jgi:hypothetical protein
MPSPTSPSTPQLGGKAGVILLLVTVLAFVGESQFTQVWSILSIDHLYPDYLSTVCRDRFALSPTFLHIVCCALVFSGRRRLMTTFQLPRALVFSNYIPSSPSLPHSYYKIFYCGYPSRPTDSHF